MTIRLLTFALNVQSDVVGARQRARQISALLGFDNREQTQIATSVSEIARNAFRYAGGGRVEFEIEGETAPQVLTVRVSDDGPGIRNLEEVLEGNYESKSGAPGIGLVLEFANDADAGHFFDLYTQQVRACATGDGSVRTKIVSDTDGLVDRRTYPDSDWTEIARQSGSRITMIILTDPGHRISGAATRAILDQIA